MIIVSQDKETIINFENITRISIVPPVEKGYKYSIAINGCLDLGYYTSKERAKEVLRDLLKRMNNQKFLMKPKRNIKQETIEAAKVYFENINGVDLIIDDNNFEIIPINKDNTIIYEMPEK